jgi:hypothetical protein
MWSGPTVRTCAAHQAEGPLLLQARLDAESRVRATDLASRAAQRDGRLL